MIIYEALGSVKHSFFQFRLSRDADELLDRLVHIMNDNDIEKKLKKIHKVIIGESSDHDVFGYEIPTPIIFSIDCVLRDFMTRRLTSETNRIYVEAGRRVIERQLKKHFIYQWITPLHVYPLCFNTTPYM